MIGKHPDLAVDLVLAILVAACSPSQAETGSSAPPETSSPDTAASDTTATTVPLDAVPSNYVGFLHQDTACGGDQPDPAVDMKFDAPGDAAVEEAVDALPDKFRSVVELVDIQGLAYAEAAEILGVPTGTVMSRLHYARQRLRAKLEPLVAGGPVRRA